MKNIMTILIMGILLVGTISAFTITNGNDWSDVAWEGESFKLKGTETYCKFLYNGNISNCDNKVYETWANKEAQDTIDSLLATPVKETEVTIIDETIKLEDYDDDTSWLKAILDKIMIKINELIFGVSELETENTLIKAELCKKDPSYKFCLSIETE